MMTTIIISVAVILLIILLWAIFISNNLIAKHNRVKQCKSGICVVLKQRNDLIPNLIGAVKTYMGHKNEVLTRIAELRSKVASASENELQAIRRTYNAAVTDYNKSIEMFPSSIIAS